LLGWPFCCPRCCCCWCCLFPPVHRSYLRTETWGDWAWISGTWRRSERRGEERREMTTFYVSHGSPMQALENTPTTDFLKEFSNLHMHERWTNFSLHPNRCQGSLIKNSSRCCCLDVVPDHRKKIAETFWLLRRWFVVGWFFWTLENGITHCCAGPKRLLQSPDIGTQRCRRWLWRAGIVQSTISMAFQRRLMRYIPTCCAWTSSRAPFAWEEYVSSFFVPCISEESIYSTLL
jgi:hypothetical protein